MGIEIISLTPLNIISYPKKHVRKYKKVSIFFPRTRCLPAIITEKYQGRIKQMKKKKERSIFFKVSNNRGKMSENIPKPTKYHKIHSINHDN